MLEPLIEFKKVKTFQGMEGEGLNADIYINGVKCFFMRDDGNGGMVDFDRYDNRKNPSIAIETNVQLVDAFIATIPDTVYPLSVPHADGRTELRIKADYESYFNQKYEDFINAKNLAKFNKGMTKKMETCIVLGIPNGNGYSSYNFEKPLSQFSKTFLQTQVNIIKMRNCKEGVQILNTNLEELGITV